MTGWRSRHDPTLKAFVREHTATYVTFAYGRTPPYSVCTVTRENFLAWYAKVRVAPSVQKRPPANG